MIGVDEAQLKLNQEDVKTILEYIKAEQKHFELYYMYFNCAHQERNIRGFQAWFITETSQICWDIFR